MISRRIVLSLGLAGVLHYGVRLLKPLLEAAFKYGGLHGLVSFSSRMIAARRAIESERSDRLFNDPLAKCLAGRQAIAKAKSYPDSKATETGGRMINRIVVRTKFFDDVIHAVLGVDVAGGVRDLVPSTDAELRQVVLLGAGMDSRPWRLDLPEGVDWFEVDQQDVIAAKLKLLEAAGAQTDAQVPGGRHKAPKHPLHTASWHTVDADLQHPGWTKALVDKGLDPRKPILWVLEGLLYYLDADTVGPMLKEAAAVSPPGSFLLANCVMQEGLDVIRESRRAAAVTPSSNSLFTYWKWGCPGDLNEYFGSNGWPLNFVKTWTEASRLIGYEPFLIGSGEKPPAQQVQYFGGYVEADAA